MVFGLLRVLGFDYRPQIADLPDAKRWHIDADADYGPLATAVRGKIDLGRIRQHWADILRLVASIHTGAVSARDVIRMVAHGGNPTQLGDALAHYGRIFKTVHALSFLDEGLRARDQGHRNLQERATTWLGTSSTAAGRTARGLPRGNGRPSWAPWA